MIRIALFLLLSASAGAEPSRRIIVFQPGTSTADQLTVAASAGGRIVRRLDLINAVVVEAPETSLTSAEGRLRAHALVSRIDPDPRINWLLAAAARPELPAVPAPRFTSSRARARRAPSGQETPWGVARVRAPAAWSRSRGRGVKVAVIDTGIADHPDLAANVRGGWSAVEKEHPDRYKDDNGHGTHVAGTIAAVDDGAGVVGVAPQAWLYAVKVLDSNGSGSFDDVIAGMQWAVENGMDVANMSLGAEEGNESLRAAVEAMARAGVVLVAAAGNSAGPVGYPAGYDGALAVAATDDRDRSAWFSSHGPQVAFAAPGVDVRSTYLGGGFDSLDGTSMAAPHVAGLAALAIGAKRLVGRDAVVAALRASASPLRGLPPERQGAGLIDAAALVR